MRTLLREAPTGGFEDCQLPDQEIRSPRLSKPRAPSLWTEDFQLRYACRRNLRPSVLGSRSWLASFGPSLSSGVPPIQARQETETDDSPATPRGGGPALLEKPEAGAYSNPEF